MAQVPIWDDLFGPEDRERARKAFDLDQLVGFGERRALLVVDMCRAFVEDVYPTGDSAHGRPTVAAIGRLLTAVRAIPEASVVFTTYSAGDFELGWARWKGQARRHPLMRTDRAFEIVPALAPQAGERVIVKTMPSAFFGTPLNALSVYHGVDTVLVTGMVTSGCIRATVVDAFSHNYRVVVPEECVGDRSELSHKVNLFGMHMKYADVRPLDDVLAYVGGLGSRGGARRDLSGPRRSGPDGSLAERIPPVSRGRAGRRPRGRPSRQG